MLDFITGLLFDGLIPIFATLLSMLPQVVILLTVVSLFENSGFILGFSCTTLAISAINQKESQNKKNRQAMFYPFIPCSAKLPVLTFIASTILGWTIFGVVFLYVFSILVGLLLGGYKILAKPILRKITFLNILKSIALNILEFLKRITIGLLLAATALYTLQYFSLLLPLTSILEPLFIPIGLGNAAIIACLLFGLIAKEMIIGAILTFGIANLGLTMASSISFIIFTLLYTPCVPCLTAIKSKLGWKQSFKIALTTFIVAYSISFLAYNAIAMLH